MTNVNLTGIITFNGVELDAEEGSISFMPGLDTAVPRKSAKGYVGSGRKTNLSKLSCNLIPKQGLDIESLHEGVEGTARLDDLFTGEGWIIPVMVATEDAEYTDGDSGNWKVTFEGAKAERVGG